MPGGAVEKGSRIRIVKGRKGKNVTGTIFWEGENKWGDGSRFGIEGDDGETYWVASANVEELDSDADEGVPDAPELERGMMVEWKKGNERGVGKVFWIGEAKNGGMRVGINADDQEEPVWLNARAVSVIGDDEPPRLGAPPVGATPVGDNDDDIPF